MLATTTLPLPFDLQNRTPQTKHVIVSSQKRQNQQNNHTTTLPFGLQSKPYTTN